MKMIASGNGASYVTPNQQMTDQQLALRPLSFGGSTGNQIIPLVLTSGMSDEELKRVRAIMYPPPPLPTKMNLMANSEFIEIASVLASRLDHVRHKRRRAIVFTQPGVRTHCNELMRTLMHGEKDQWPDVPFEIDEWFSDTRGGDLDYDPTDPTADVRKTRFQGEMQLDWVEVLIVKELDTNGFCKVLYNCLTLEERIEHRLKEQHRETMGTLGSASGFA